MSGSTNWEQVYKVQSARIEELERENAALREDKERLDWLCNDMGNQWAWTHMNSMLEDSTINRSVIDAARKGGQL